MLNFSSEIEFDDRFDLEEYEKETGGAVAKIMNKRDAPQAAFQ